MNTVNKEIFLLITNCREEKNIDRQVSMLLELNQALPPQKRVSLQSFYTKDYVRRVLSWIEDSVL